MDAKIIEFFFKNKRTTAAIKYISLYILSIYVFGIFLNYALTQSVDFNIGVWIDNFKSNQKIIIAMFMVYTIVLMSSTYYFYTKYQELKTKNEVVILKLEDVAYTWVNDKKPNNDEKEVVDAEIVKEEKDIQNETTTEHLKYISFKDFSINRFFSTIILKNANEFTKDELTIVLDILKLLETHGGVSSVASKFKNDAEIDWINQIKAFNDYKTGKQNYELLSKINIKTHTINVADYAVEAFKAFAKTNKDEVVLVDLPLVVIAALAHDIGKIVKRVSDVINLPENIIFQNNHTNISIEYFEKIAGKYARKDSVKEAIRSHHQAYAPTDILSKIIFESDKKAREKESKEIIEKIKKEADESEETNNKEEKPIQKPEATDTNDIIIDKVVALMKKNINKYKVIDANGNMIASIKSLTPAHVESISSKEYAYFTYLFLKNLIVSAVGKNLTQDEIKETMKQLSQKGIITIKGNQATQEIVVNFFDNLLFTSYMVPVSLEKLGISKEESLANVVSVYKTEGLYVKE